MQEMDPAFVVFSVVILIFSVVAHEVSHGYMAQYLGDPTARLKGRLTLNPLVHLDPIWSVLVPALLVITNSPILFGMAKPVPYNPYNLRDQKWGDAKVAASGPLTNLGIAAVFALLLRFGGEMLSGPVGTLVNSIVVINVILAVFNLVPIPPLDGSKILFNALPLKYRYIQEYLERYSLVLLLVFILFLWPVIVPVVRLLYLLLTGMSL
jgi:Zn-dependent protease